MKPAFKTFTVIRRLTLGLLLTLPFSISAGDPVTPDLALQTSTSLHSTAFVGSKSDWIFKITSAGANTPATFPTGTVVLKVDFPLNTSVDSFTTGSTWELSGDLSCAFASSSLTCLSVNNFTLIGNTSQIWVRVFGASPSATGTFTVPRATGVCMVNPDSAVSEDSLDNNSCGPFSSEVGAAPAITTTRWMGVNMWDNVVRIYDQASNTQVNAAPFNMSFGTDVHALDDIARNPVTGVYYVFPRWYQSNTHRLATFNPVTGIGYIADTGLSFHDSAFGEDGTLYAVGRNSNLYTLHLANAIPTQLCSTPYGSNTGNHSALAWDSDTDELLQIVDGMIGAIDLQNLPVNPSDPCVITTTPISEAVDTDVFAAVFDDGNLYVSDYSGNFFLLGRNGAALQLGALPMVMHSLVPDPGTLPLKPVPCPADAYVIAETSGYGVDLFAVNTNNASLTWITTLANIPTMMDHDPVSGLLVTARYDDGETAIEQYHPCTGELVSAGQLTSDPATYRGIDIQSSGDALLFGFYNSVNNTLASLDLGTLMVSALGSVLNSGRDLAVVDDTVFLTHGSSVIGNTLYRYRLSNWPAEWLGELVLSFGAGLEKVNYREIDVIDPVGNSGEFLTIVQRTFATSFGTSAVEVPNKLARIDATGLVTGIGTLPTSAYWVATYTSGVIFGDGFEATTVITD